MHRKIIFTMTAFFISFSSFALTYEEYVNSRMNEYQAYLEQIDREFSSFLKQQWKEYQGQEPVQAYEKPKPVVPPVADPSKPVEPVQLIPKTEPKPLPVAKPVHVVPEKPKVPETKPEPVKLPETAKAPAKAPETKPAPEARPKEPVKTPETEKPLVKQPVKPVVPPVTVPAVPEKPKGIKTEPAEPSPAYEPKTPEPKPFYEPAKEGESVSLSFYGLNLIIPYDKNILADVRKPISSDNVAAWWEKVASADYKKTLSYMEKEVKKNSLGDWGYVLLLERFTAKLKGTAAEQKMLVWFFLNKGGYNTKLGYTKSGNVKVMMPSDSELYGVSYYVFSGERYYVINTFEQKQDEDSLYTYKGSYPKADKSLVLKKLSAPKLSFAGYSKDLKFDFKKENFTVKPVVNRYNMAFYNTFPQAELSVYTTAKMPEWVDKTVVPAISAAVKNKSLEDSVNLILRFVQTAFEYKTDDGQFGREKFFFAEEIFYYPYSDCEDRSILFAYLIKEVLNRDVVLLNFPNHVATAVDMGDKTQGAFLMYKNKKYTIADPTYINASAGMVMPQFKGVNPGIEETGI